MNAFIEILDLFLTGFGLYFLGHALGLIFVVATVWCFLALIFGMAVVIAG